MGWTTNLQPSICCIVVKCPVIGETSHLSYKKSPPKVKGVGHFAQAHFFPLANLILVHGWTFCIRVSKYTPLTVCVSSSRGVVSCFLREAYIGGGGGGGGGGD